MLVAVLTVRLRTTLILDPQSITIIKGRAIAESWTGQ